MAFDALRSRGSGTGFGVSAAMLATLLALLVMAPTPGRVPPTVPDSLRFTLIVPDTVRTGQPVRITLHLTNVTTHPVEAHFMGREIAFDIVVAGKDDRVVWRRLAHAVVPGILQVRILSPNEQLEFSDVWRQGGDDGKPAAPGSYTLWGVLPSDEREPRRTDKSTLRITP